MSNNPAEEMFRFVESVQHLEDRGAISDQLLRSARSFGLMNFGISGLPDKGEKIDPYVLLCGWPEEWFARYAERGYVHADPVIARTRETDTPFTWSEAIGQRALTPSERRTMDEASEFRMMDGFTVPIHSIHGLSAIVTFGAEKVQLGEKERGALHMIAIYAHNRLRTLPSGGGTDNGKRSKLTMRERDCVLWCAQGKTNWEISAILGLSERTIEAYLKNAGVKLGTVNRAHLVAESIRRGVIH
ncbi:LuxR family transcriptional regulator [Jiella sp. M17.18]|uniref:helix-turn-helix transcriptional regulator n=1 Tax=Jiella sp. M17.18 TaxID=3234247 RepID=UPI0034DE840F